MKYPFLCLIAFQLLLLSGCAGGAGDDAEKSAINLDTVPAETTKVATDIPEIQENVGVWRILSSQPEGPVGLMLGFQEYDRLRQVYLEYDKGNILKKWEREGLEITTEKGAVFMVMEIKEITGEPCSGESNDMGLNTGTESYRILGWGKSHEAARAHAREQINNLTAESEPPACGSHSGLSDDVLFVTPRALCARTTSFYGKDEGGGSDEQEYFAIDFSTGDTVKLRDYFPGTAVQAATGAVGNSLGQQFMGEPIPVTEEQLDLLLSRQNAKTMAHAIYSQTFELDPVEGKGLFGEAGPPLQTAQTLPMSFEEVKAEYPKAKDVFIPPTQEVAFLQLDSEIQGIDIQTGAVIFTMKYEGELVLVEWEGPVGSEK